MKRKEKKRTKRNLTGKKEKIFKTEKKNEIKLNIKHAFQLSVSLLSSVMTTQSNAMGYRY